MYIKVTVILCLVGLASSAPRVRVSQRDSSTSPPGQLMSLPSNATSIREDIVDTFSCENRKYGYYADMDNGCQIFHVCLPVVFPNGKERTFRWSFICPEETQFNQENFTCARSEDSIDCEESVRFYDLNDMFGQTTETPKNLNPTDTARIQAQSQVTTRPNTRG